MTAIPTQTSVALTAPRQPSIPLAQWLVAGAVAAFLLFFLVIPVATVVVVAFLDPRTGGFTLVNFADFLRNDLFIRSFWNSVWVSGMAVAWATVFALPLAYITSRFNFRGAVLIQTLGVIPLIMPPFAGAWRCSSCSAATARSTCCWGITSTSTSRSWRG